MGKPGIIKPWKKMFCDFGVNSNMHATRLGVNFDRLFTNILGSVDAFRRAVDSWKTDFSIHFKALSTRIMLRINSTVPLELKL